MPANTSHILVLVLIIRSPRLVSGSHPRDAGIGALSVSHVNPFEILGVRFLTYVQVSYTPGFLHSKGEVQIQRESYKVTHDIELGLKAWM